MAVKRTPLQRKKIVIKLPQSRLVFDPFMFRVSPVPEYNQTIIKKYSPVLLFRSRNEFISHCRCLLHFRNDKASIQTRTLGFDIPTYETDYDLVTFAVKIWGFATTQLSSICVV